MRAANEINLRMAPLTPDHHFYIDQGANAHVRLVLIAIGEKLVEMDVLDAPDDVVLLRYNELRAFIGDPEGIDGRAIAARATRRARIARTGSSRATGSAPRPRPSSPSRTSPTGASPRSSIAARRRTRGRITGIAGSPGVVEGVGAGRARARASSTRSSTATSSSAR